MAWNAQGGSDAMGAIRDAIGMYMGLREKKSDDERQKSADSRAERQLDLQAQAAQLDASQLDEAKNANQRRAMEYLITNFGGEYATPETVQEGTKLGYGSAFEPDMTLQSSQQGGLPLGGGLTSIGQTHPSAPTGMTRFKQPESEKMRIAQMNAYTRAIEGNANRGNRLEVANISAATQTKRIAAQQAIAAAAQSLGRYRADLGSFNAQQALVQRANQFASLLEDRDIDNMTARLRANPLAILDYLGDGGGPPMPTGISQPPAPPAYYNPPTYGGSPQHAPTGGSSRFTEVP